MEKLVEFTTADGRTVLVETTDNRSGPLTRGGTGGEVLERAQRTLEDAISRVHPAVEVMVDQLASLARQPSAVSVEFGIDLHAECGAVVAKSGATANFTVTLTWDGGPDT
ncbi:CU044_2847 family protein [Kocuria sp. CPCC 205268]|uniref:CU044_2847 family protein n=1 Tax=Kocuria oxytropis TaxID=3058913 RepID=UPI0034D5A565